MRTDERWRRCFASFFSFSFDWLAAIVVGDDIIGGISGSLSLKPSVSKSVVFHFHDQC